MVLAWDEEKRQANIANHGFDFEGVEAIFDGPVFSWDDDREATHHEIRTFKKEALAR